MESLGFIDSPSTAKHWTRAESAATVSSIPTVAPPSEDPFANWTPSEVGQKLVNNSIRWGYLAGILMAVLGLAGLGYWLSQQPGQATEAANSQLVATVETLKPNIESLLASDMSTTSGDLSGSIRLVNADARSLFSLSGTLLNSLDSEGSLAGDIASQALEGTRLVNDANAYRSAVIPILAVPTFETDPALIAIDDAALSFGSWQARFIAVTTALPPGTMTALGDELESIAAELDGLHTKYLDAVRNGDRGGTAVAIHTLDTRLEQAEMILETEFETMAERARLQFTGALEAIDLLLG